MYRLNFGFLSQFYGLLLEGAIRSLTIIFFSAIIGFIFGTMLALGRRANCKLLNVLCAAIVDVLRNTPFLVQLFFMFYGLAQLGIKTQPMITVIITLGISASASNCEVIRAGFLAVKKQYFECSAALGFSPLLTLRYVVLPISLRVAFKPLTNNFVNLILTSAVAFYIGIPELMGNAQTIISRVSRPFEMYLVILMCYCIFTFALSFLAKIIDRRISITL